MIFDEDDEESMRERERERKMKQGHMGAVGHVEKIQKAFFFNKY